MRVTWFGIACIKLETNGQSVLFDPFIRRYGNAEDKIIPILKQEKTILVTHGHFDHIADIGRIYRNQNNVFIYATKTPLGYITEDGIREEQLKEIQPGECLHVNGFAIEVKKGNHIDFDKALIKKTIFNKRMIQYVKELPGLLASWKKYKENGEILFFEIHAENKLIQLMGSAGLDLEETYSQHADLLIMAYQGRSDIAAYCMKIVEKLQPKKIMLTHFDDAFPPISRDVDTKVFYKMMKDKYPYVEIMIPQLDLNYEV